MRLSEILAWLEDATSKEVVAQVKRAAEKRLAELDKVGRERTVSVQTGDIYQPVGIDIRANPGTDLR